MSDIIYRINSAFAAHSWRTTDAPQWVILGNGVYYELVGDREGRKRLNQTGPDTLTYSGVPVLIVTNAPNLVYVA